MDAGDALTYATAAPFIALLLTFVMGIITIPTKIIPLCALCLSYVWGVILIVSDRYDYGGDLAQFVVMGLMVSLTASGVHSTLRVYVPPYQTLANKAADQKGTPTQLPAGDPTPITPPRE